MKISEFKYNLRDDLIAKYPPKERGTSNLLILDRESGNIVHRKYFNIPEYIKQGDIVVLNSTKVLSCRTFFTNSKEKKVEVLFLEDRGNGKWFCLIGRAKDVKLGDILMCKDFSISVDSREGNGFLVNFVKGDAYTLFEKYGHTPLPPYMKREDEKSDKDRYNTVFSSVPGAVAAPTASLNLTNEILEDIKKKGAKIVEIELRVGWGTFAPIREERIEEHKIHKEYVNVSKEVADQINGCKRKVWAFGTTVARALESCYSDGYGKLVEYDGYTDLYIYPGYRWKVVDVLVTNFHMPDSSLILLVSSFGGKENIKRAYNEAIEKGYKFLSYGDSMLIK
ncbi:tRNA preQ1(34) S-adenosylmethionine ribosyltransferase-isomerase QueA [Candidatus Dojkabacteria bacterium]|nr:tRNA preQ1(34) S-adenosylmethionine ribosyltransferase-isomerase QueA [Candidatus Dojkabacteria bacterium]